MDENGNIYLLKNHPDIEKVKEELNLVLIPDDEYPKVANMSEKEKKAWYKEHKELEPVA